MSIIDKYLQDGGNYSTNLNEDQMVKIKKTTLMKSKNFREAFAKAAAANDPLLAKYNKLKDQLMLIRKAILKKYGQSKFLTPTR